MKNNRQTDAKPVREYVIESLVSGDGTCINYRSFGQGPGIVILHGSMESAQSHMALANALADQFTVYLPERRGHHLGGSKNYCMKKEVEDLDALLTKTGAYFVFGVSSAGLICLQAALDLPAVQKIALYEPALVIDGSISASFLARYEKEIAAGDIAGALVTAMLGAKLAPPILNIIPRWLMELMTKMTMKSEDKKAKPGQVTMRMLAPTLHYDFQLIIEMAESLERFARIKAQVLLLGGSKSPQWLRAALGPIEKVLKNVKRIDFEGLDHGGSSDISSTNRGGNPDLVAWEMRHFFQGGS